MIEGSISCRTTRGRARGPEASTTSALISVTFDISDADPTLEPSNRRLAWLVPRYAHAREPNPPPMGLRSRPISGFSARRGDREPLTGNRASSELLC